MRIFTETRSDIQFPDLDQATYPDLSGPVIYVLKTDSYSSDEVSSYRKLLSVQEQQKASHFRFLRDEHSYIITHAMLRTILGKYLASEPAEIEFVSNQFGKPSLTQKEKTIYFNLSHRSGRSVLAFSPKGEIGIDIEKMDPTFDFNQIVQAHFSKAENDFINAIQEKACEKFYTLWTRKEALLKAIGTGIGENLGIEVFRVVNHCHPDSPFPGIQETDYYLNSFVSQDNYLITVAGSSQAEFNCMVIEEQNAAGIYMASLLFQS